MRILRSSARRFFLGGISFAAYELCLSPDGENFRSHAKQLWNNFSVGETVKVWDAEHLVQKVEAAWDETKWKEKEAKRENTAESKNKNAKDN